MSTVPTQPVATPAALLDVQAVRELLGGCSARHIYRLADRGAMPRPVKLGSLVRWRRSTGDPMTGLDDWLAAGCPSCRKGGRHE
jgi:predicted DNA-binding transcriptional regulator AlpA